MASPSSHTSVLPASEQPRRRALLIAATVVAVVPATGLAVVALGRASANVAQHWGLVLLTAALAVAAVTVFARRSPAVRTAAIASILVTLVAMAAVIGARSQERVVDERVITATASTAPVDEATAPDQTTAQATSAPSSSPTALAAATTARTQAPAAPAAAAPASDPREDPAAPETAPRPTPTPAPVASKPAATPTPVSNTLIGRGQLEELDHDGGGTASLIKAADGRTVLTFTDFTVEPGPDYVVWLVRGNPASDDAAQSATRVELGALKGTSGDQQYVVPAGTDLAGVTHAYVWCRAFSVGVLRARLA